MVCAAWGISDTDRAGWPVLLADLNGDGVADLVITAQGGDGLSNLRGPASGEIYIRFGTPSYDVTQDLFTDPADVVIYGVNPGDLLATSLAAGDLDADGIDDLVMRVPLGDGPDNDRLAGGEVYVLYGRESWASEIDLANPDPCP